MQHEGLTEKARGLQMGYARSPQTGHTTRGIPSVKGLQPLAAKQVLNRVLLPPLKNTLLGSCINREAAKLFQVQPIRLCCSCTCLSWQPLLYWHPGLQQLRMLWLQERKMLPSFQKTQEEQCSDVNVTPRQETVEKSTAPMKDKGAEPSPSSLLPGRSEGTPLSPCHHW